VKNQIVRDVHLTPFNASDRAGPTHVASWHREANKVLGLQAGMILIPEERNPMRITLQR